MKKGKILFSFLALVLVLGLVSGCTMEPIVPGEELEEEQEEELEEGVSVLRQEAEGWIVGYSPTYVFDGSELKFIRAEKTEMGGQEFVFEFTSSHAGYGDRTDEVVAQVITPHNIFVKVSPEGEVVEAVTDQVYDELNEVMIDIEGEEEEEVEEE